MVLLYKYDLEDNLNNQKKFDDLQQLVNNDLKKVDTIIKEKIKNKINYIPEVAGYLVKAGGKRIRPMLCLACARLCNYKGTKHINLSACIEFIHTATLLHDDVIDESKKRRGLKTANNIWGNKSSILVGDFLLSKSFELMTELENIEVLKILSSSYERAKKILIKYREALESLAKTLIEQETIDGDCVHQVMQEYEPKTKKKTTVKTRKQKIK